MDVKSFFHAVISQDAEKMKEFLLQNALIFWHNTNERFSAEDYIRVNCDYPGKWHGEVERIDYAEKVIIAVTKFWNEEADFRAVSFIELGEDDKISRMDEYWGDITPAPEWRKKEG